jgi:hypothetical protein
MNAAEKQRSRNQADVVEGQWVLESCNAEFVALGLTNLGPHRNQHDILVQVTLLSCINHHNDERLSFSTFNNVTKIYEPNNGI